MGLSIISMQQFYKLENEGLFYVLLWNGYPDGVFLFSVKLCGYCYDKGGWLWCC